MSQYNLQLIYVRYWKDLSIEPYRLNDDVSYEDRPFYKTEVYPYIHFQYLYEIDSQQSLSQKMYCVLIKYHHQ